MWASVVTASLLALPLVTGQDMRENCVSCSDTKRRCEIDCMLPTYRKNQELAWPYNHPENFADMSVCLETCSTSYASCEETEEQKACLSCVSACAVTFEANMLFCLQSVQDLSSKATVDDTSDDCSTNVTYAMNVCSESCYSTDVYHGWSPSTEEGLTAAVPSQLDTLVPDYRRASEEGFVPVLYAHSEPEESRSKPTELREAVSRSTKDSAGQLGLQGVLGLSGLVATVILTAGLLTVSRLNNATD